MKSSYKRLGDYIQVIKDKNVDLRATKLLGINIDKFFMPSVANIVGTDLSNYKIVKKNQFACNRMHVGRDYRIPIALSNDENEFIVSPAYDVFEIIDTNALLPEYLMMWFRRKEFDRNTWFHTDADVRGGLPWEAFSNLKPPIPSPEKQQEIVNEYHTIQNRINLNNQLIAKLEETAQTIYKQWFVDFEFPDEHGKPYKSNGGKMLWCEELEKEIPEGWEVGKIDFFVTTQYGFTDSANFEKGTAKFLRITDVVNKYINWNTVPFCNIVDKEIEKYKLEYGDFIISRTGANVGFGKMIGRKNPLSVFASFLVRLKSKKLEYLSYLYCLIISDTYRSFILSNAEGSAQPQANASLLTKMDCLIPDKEILKMFNYNIKQLLDFKELKETENQKLSELKELLLGRMVKRN